MKGRKLLSNGRRDPQLLRPWHIFVCQPTHGSVLRTDSSRCSHSRWPILNSDSTRLVFVDIDFKSSVSASLSSSAFVQFYSYSFPWNYFTDVCNCIQLFSNQCDNYRYVATFRSPIWFPLEVGEFWANRLFLFVRPISWRCQLIWKSIRILIMLHFIVK